MGEYLYLGKLTLYFITFHNAVWSTMKSTGTISCLQRSLAATSKAVRSPSERSLLILQCRTVHQRFVQCKALPLRNVAAQRTFSINAPGRFAQVDDTFDLKTQDRESDQVDVCIVGGGLFFPRFKHQPLIENLRACWA